MECNKGEALRAKELSEGKLIDKDYVGAKILAQKAEKLFPGLEGLSHLFIVLDVYIASEKKISGELDWYGILGVVPTTDDDTIRKSYRNLILSLHPDKNKSVGAEGAFKLVSQAWMLLSDKIKRKAYDQKRNIRPVYQKVVPETQKSRTSTSTAHPTKLVPRPSKTKTFWTSCTKCLMHFEYANAHRDQKILCPNCSEPFWARESPAPPMRHLATPWPSQTQNQNAKHHVNSKQGPSLNKANANHVNVKPGPSINTSTVHNSGQFKRRHEVKVCSGKGDATVKKRRAAEQSFTVPASSAYAKVNFGGDKANASTRTKINHSTRELSQAEIRNMLMTKARNVIHKKLDEWNEEDAAKKEVIRKEALKNEVIKNEGNKKESEIADTGKKYAEQNTVNVSKVKEVKMPSEDKMNIDDMDTDVKETEAILMSVPDPDFHDFDMDRTESSFSENQIWAAYDEDDGMPRYYAMIHSVISKKPFKMQISWLNSKGNAELGPINWVASGFPKTSGDFRTGKHEINKSLNSFSHKIHWTKGKKGVIQIYPRKGDVWAVYKNWSPDWNEFTPDEVIHDYNMVVVVEDFNEVKGVKVAPLVKVAGFKSVFHQHSDVKEAWMIPKEEIFRLSHQVPFYMLAGEEAINVPKGCLELDPAALPLELLQTTAEAKGKVLEDGNSKNAEVKEIITYFRKTGKKPKLQGKEICSTS
ncbi:DnaJ domain-containing protein [Tanacetum coccineum]